MNHRGPAHVPVMLREVLDALAPRSGGAYVDATFGAGGYTSAILEAAQCRVFALDCDPQAVAEAERLRDRYGDRLRAVQGRFGDMERLLAGAGMQGADGIAFDLGMSSGQVDAADRGFSFRLDGPLDMRMDGDATSPSAADAVNTLSEEALARLLRELGEERAARRIARAIANARARAPLTRTSQLSDVVRGIVRHQPGGIDPATRTFQALRIYVNDELGELDRGLHAAERLLVPGGRLCVVSYHSLEDRAVKSFLRERSGDEPRPSRHAPQAAMPSAARDRPPPSFRLLRRGAVRPAAAEVAANPRARSARLRAAERTAAPPWSGPEGQRRAA